MLFPKKTKYRKQFKGTIKGVATRGTNVDFGAFGLKSLGAGFITSRQLESARRAITRHLKRGGKVWIRVFPDKPITQKAAETPMGSGKGSVEYYVAVVRPGRMLFEIDGVSELIAREAFRLAAYKLPVKTKFITQ